MIKHLFFSMTLFNLSSSLFCMTGMLQRMKLALPSALCVARMPKPQLLPQRNLIYNFYVQTHGSKSSPEPDDIMESFVSASIRYASNPQKALNISEKKPRIYFARVYKGDKNSSKRERYFSFQTSQDAQKIASSAFKIDGEGEIFAYNKKTGKPFLFNNDWSAMTYRFKGTKYNDEDPVRYKFMELDKDHAIEWYYYQKMSLPKLLALKAWHNRKEIYEWLKKSQGIK